MQLELIPLSKYETCDNPVELDDYSSGSYAVYKACNHYHKTFIFFKPDEHRSPEPRCDFVLTNETDLSIETRFIELKGADEKREQKKNQCCKTEWNHAFHQLYCTFEAFRLHMDLLNEKYKFILCTSLRKKPVTKFTQYPWYRNLLVDFHADVQILYDGQADSL